jgi:hypothetical protein
MASLDQPTSGLIAAGAFGPNTEKVVNWLDELQTLTPDTWRRILVRVHDSPEAFSVAAPVVEKSSELRAGMLRIATQTGRAVANAATDPAETALLLSAARNAGLAVLTVGVVPGDVFAELFKPFKDATPQDPVRQRMRRLLRASGDSTANLVGNVEMGPTYLVLTEFFAAGLAYMVQAGKTANGTEWAQLFLSGCMGVCGGVAAFYYDEPTDFEEWFHDAVMLGLRIYVLGPSLNPDAMPRDFNDRVRKITAGKVKNGGKALPRFREVLKGYGLLDV